MTNPVDMSVVIPAHNAAATLRRALCSVFSQLPRPREVIVIDDGSVDGTDAIAREFASVIVLTNRVAVGAAAARNRGIMEASGKLVAFLDADDEWLPGKLERQCAMLPVDLDFAFSHTKCLLRREGVPGEMYVNAGREVPHGALAWKALLRNPAVATPSVVTPRGLLTAVGGFRADMVTGEDQDLWIRLARRGVVVYLDEPLVRVHEQSTGLSTRHRGKDADVVLEMIERHMASAGGELTKQERRGIRSNRFVLVGKSLCDAGQRVRGLKYLAKALGHGADRWTVASAALTSVPGVVELKSRLRLGGH